MTSVQVEFKICPLVCYVCTHGKSFLHWHASERIILFLHFIYPRRKIN